jgi:hypothetical protein
VNASADEQGLVAKGRGCVDGDLLQRDVQVRVQRVQSMADEHGRGKVEWDSFQMKCLWKGSKKPGGGGVRELDSRTVDGLCLYVRGSSQPMVEKLWQCLLQNA